MFLNLISFPGLKQIQALGNALQPFKLGSSCFFFEDALSSIIVARDGFGDMAVSNAIGSNVFDINLGIGLPFVIRGLIDNFEPIHLLTKTEEVRFVSP